MMALLKKPSNIKVTRNFLSFLKQTFSGYVQGIEVLSNLAVHTQEYKDKKQEVLLQEETVLEVLRMIENSCELCNEDF